MSEQNIDEKPKEDFPQWLNKDFFLDLISEKCGKNEFEVSDLKLSYVVGKGENYVAVMYRAEIEILIGDGTQFFSFIVKAMPETENESELPAEMIAALNPFKTESKMYSHFIPTFESIFKEKGLKDPEFGPKCHKSMKTPNQILVLDDLKDLGFKMADRKVGLNVNHAKILLKKLAQFHAASAIYVSKIGPFDESFREGIIYKESNRAMYDDYKEVTRNLFKEMNKWSFGPRYVDVMEKSNLIDTYFDIILDVTKFDEHGFNVMNHGDIWTNNFMFQYDDEGSVNDARLIDFQISFYGSPVLDLHYLFISSLAKDIKLKEMPNLLRFYYDNLVENLKILDYDKPIPTMKQLHLDFVNRDFFGLIWCFDILPICLFERKVTKLFEYLNSDKEDEETIDIKDSYFNNPAYVSAMEELLPYFYNRGTLEVKCSE